jgi:DNA helicase-2/ATP-dependent DNA helicase PcrA
MENYIEGLNPQQLEAVKATEGRIRVVAGAGSGKTKTLTSRFCYGFNI